MNKYFKFFIVITFILTSQISFSQTGKFSYAVFGGLSFPTGDLKKQDAAVFYGGNDYGMNSGFNLGGSAKYAMDRMGIFDLTGSIVYNSFKNSPDGFGADTKINLFSLNIGGQYNFIPNRQFNPYVNIALTNNFFSGSNSSVLGDSKLKSSYRFGLQFGGGVEIGVSDKIGVLVGARYDLANLVGKSYDSTFTSTAEYPLDDATYTSSGVSVPAKTISFIQVYTGVSIYLNRSLKK
ncbi:hypothetical protein BH10BAC5_BH10BAC5_03610 [soil metagenome]